MRPHRMSRRAWLSLMGATSMPLSVYGAVAATPRRKKPATTDAAAQTAYALWTPEVLGEQVWLRWSVDDLSPGTRVSAWGDRMAAVTATQPDPAGRPLMTPDGVVFEPNQRLVLPHQSRAYLAHRAVVLLFRLDASTVAFDSGSLVHFNGASGSANARQPALLYRRQDVGVCDAVAEWRDPRGPAALNFRITGDFSQWHCLVTRRHDGRHYASLDGLPEFEMGDDLCLPRGDASVGGMIGDFRSPGVRWAIDTLMVLQDQLSAEDAQRLMGWALWKRGAQEVLPASHPYRTHAPGVQDAPPRPVYQESSIDEWAAIQRYWDSTDQALELEQGYLSPLDLSGYRLVFEDHFTSMTLSDDLTGTGPWWTPVHAAATGSARTAKLSDQPSVFSQSDSELTIRLLRTPAGWTSGVFSSVNLNGHGNTWKYGYFEFRARASRGNGFGAWPAFWVKSVNEFFRLTESRLELDLYEGYNSDPQGHHQSYHNWPAARYVPGRVDKHRYVSNYTGLKPPAWGEGGVDLFDDAFHTYGMMIDERWVKFYFDGRELARFPTPIEAKQEVFILVDLALNPKEKDHADGFYELAIDYVRVYSR